MVVTTGAHADPRLSAGDPDGVRFVIAHLMASPFFGGPEKQMLGMSLHLPRAFRSVFLTFSERGRCAGLVDAVRSGGLDAIVLEENFPRLGRSVGEVEARLRELRADILCCSGYKPDVVGWLAARRVGIPAIAVAHGWTGATWRVRLYETVDRRILRRFSAVVAVSQAQADLVMRAGVSPERVAVIRNAVGPDQFEQPDPASGERLRKFFRRAPARIVGAAGRLSPEKGFDTLVRAARLVRDANVDAGFVVFGDGPLRESLHRLIRSQGLEDRFILAGFRSDLGRFLPHLDLAVLPSYAEGLPVVLLEALAAGVPVVATRVGGIPEVIDDGVQGFLVSPRDFSAMALRIQDALADPERLHALGSHGRQRVREEFMFHAQATRYADLFTRVSRNSSVR